MKLQEYLNNLSNKDQIKELDLAKIQLERGETEFLEGGELDLSEFTNLEKLELDPNLLKTPLKKVNVNGLTQLKELIWPEQESEEDKKLFTELGISGNLEKQKVVKEVQILAELKKIKVNFGTEIPSEEDRKELVERKEIYLILDQKDKLGNFCPELVFWNFCRELSAMGDSETTETPIFWTNFDKELEWVKQNIRGKWWKYFQELESLMVPSLFPVEKLDINKILVVNYEKGGDVEKSFPINSQLVDKAWQIIRGKALELGIRAIIHYNQPNYTIMINYAPDNPNKEELEKIMTETPLQLENEYLKEKQEQLPSSEKFEKLKKQVEILEKYLKDNLDEEDYQKIKVEVDKIN